MDGRFQPCDYVQYWVFIYFMLFKKHDASSNEYTSWQYCMSPNAFCDERRKSGPNIRDSIAGNGGAVTGPVVQLIVVSLLVYDNISTYTKRT
jgi:hypothetical protein